MLSFVSEFIGLPMSSEDDIAGASGTHSGSSEILTELKDLKFTFSRALEAISAWVDKLSKTVYGPSAHRQTPVESGSHSWDELCESFHTPCGAHRTMRRTCPAPAAS